MTPSFFSLPASMKTVSPDSLLCLPVFLRSDWSSDQEDEKSSSELFEFDDRDG
jgi:hypothetical protein